MVLVDEKSTLPVRGGAAVLDERVQVLRSSLRRQGGDRGVADGFPRNLAQAEALDGILADSKSRLDAVLDLEIPEAQVVRRIAGRRLCRQNREHIFHVDYSPPEVAGACDVCGGELYQRDDDRETTVRKRLEVYRSETAPVVDHYQAQGLVTTISALGQVQEVLDRALVAIGQARLMPPARRAVDPSARKVRGCRP
ncbi:nucleoside monophosphate kinase [Streptomyces sp. DT2A-34]|uniref:nucleoside monophosphate kinase n=1 Tax=Streptomyces sp. DT2A-34 TaxID=3051182 RepID=UPI00265C69E7|nr:nucleoside monophosphate kinase [Streptomyces sp. DT2A-34]MDO0909322.1 nucleoside monophosphate kinase [Streptomyces sp. DT2A-34]